MKPHTPARPETVFSRYPLAFVFLFMTLCLLPVMILRDFSPSNELRYLSLADEALAGRHFFAFTNHGIPYADKPPLYLWLVMLCRAVFGRHSMAALSLLFSFLPALGIITVMDRWVRQTGSGDRAASALMLGTCALFAGMAVFIRMDMLMCLFIVLALYTFYQMDAGIGNSRRHGVLLPVWIFLALFTKGPVGLLVPPVSILCFLAVRGRLREAGRFLGWKTWGILAGLCAVWFFCVWLDGGSDYLNNLLFHQTLGRAVHSFHHKRPFWYYLVSFWYSTAPWCLLLAGTLAASLSARKKAGPRSDTEVLFLCVILSTFVMLSAFSGKLAIYLAPVFPFLVYLFPMVLERTGPKPWQKWTLAVAAFLLAAVALAALLGLTLLRSHPGIARLAADAPYLDRWPVKLGAVLLLTGCLTAGIGALRDRPWRQTVFLTSSSLLLAVYCVSTLLPQVNAYTAYGAICREVPAGTDVITAGLHRPENIDVYLGQGVEDFGKDFEGARARMEALAPQSRPLTLMTTQKALSAHPWMKEGPHRIGYAGNYCVITRYPTGAETGVPESSGPTDSPKGQRR